MWESAVDFCIATIWLATSVLQLFFISFAALFPIFYSRSFFLSTNSRSVYFCIRTKLHLFDIVLFFKLDFHLQILLDFNLLFFQMVLFPFQQFVQPVHIFLGIFKKLTLGIAFSWSILLWDCGIVICLSFFSVYLIFGFGKEKKYSEMNVCFSEMKCAELIDKPCPCVR